MLTANGKTLNTEDIRLG